MRQNVILGREYTRGGADIRRVGNILHYTILRIITGRAIVSVCGKSYNCRAGDLLFVKGGEACRVEQVLPGEMLGYESYAFLPNSVGRDGEILCFYAENRHKRFESDGYLLCTLLDSVKKEEKRGDGGELALSLIRSVLIASKPDCSCADPAGKRAALVAIFVLNNFNEQIDVDVCARAVGMSRGYISRNFAQQMGISLNAYIRQVRVRAAAELILDGERVSDAAVRCGFATSSGFYKAFEAVLGKNPTEYACSVTSV